MTFGPNFHVWAHCEKGGSTLAKEQEMRGGMMNEMVEPRVKSKGILQDWSASKWRPDSTSMMLSNSRSQEVRAEGFMSSGLTLEENIFCCNSDRNSGQLQGVEQVTQEVLEAWLKWKDTKTEEAGS